MDLLFVRILSSKKIFLSCCIFSLPCFIMSFFIFMQYVFVPACVLLLLVLHSVIVCVGGGFGRVARDGLAYK